jgi:hypothetical protein
MEKGTAEGQRILSSRAIRKPGASQRLSAHRIEAQLSMMNLQRNVLGKVEHISVSRQAF